MRRLKEKQRQLWLVALLAAATAGYAQTEAATEADVARINARLESIDKRLAETEKIMEATQKNVDRIADSTESNARLIEGIEKEMDEAGATMGKRIDTTASEVDKSKIYAGCGFAVAIIIALIVLYVLRKKIGKSNLDIKSIMETTKRLTEQFVLLDNRLATLMEQQLKEEPEDHSLILSIVNEMARIEQNLAFMDSSTKGVSQLKNRAAAISADLAAKGYEVPKLINTIYKEGMNYEAVMEADESVPVGEQRIKRVVRPCVIYKGKMIQTAKVVVAINPDEE